MTSEDHPWPFDFGPPFYPFGEMMRPNVERKEKSGAEETSNSNKKPESQSESTHHHHSYQHHQQFSKPGPFAPNIKYVPLPPSGEDKRSKLNHRWHHQGDPRGKP